MLIEATETRTIAMRRHDAIDPSAIADRDPETMTNGAAAVRAGRSQAARAGAGEADRWRAVLARDRGADGRFVYAVRSTGVYCRPSCPSRRPVRSSVAFFDTPPEAERAGFRACKRCRPDGQAPNDRLMERVRRACALIAANPDERPTLAALTARIGGSPYHFQRTFKRLMGISPREYAEACRVGRLKGHLQRGDDVAGALYEAGYGSSSRLYERAPAELGMTPAIYRRGGDGARISFTTVRTRLGRLLVAATGRGLCAVKLGEADSQLERSLRGEFPRASVTRDDGALASTVSALVASLDGSGPAIDLPVDVRATAFQRLVWRHLRAIPYGETRTYGEIAAAIGRPRATRAVAGACAANPVALVVPCHRVVPSAGGVGGYRWGAERKKALLAHESGNGVSRAPSRAVRP